MPGSIVRPTGVTLCNNRVGTFEKYVDRSNMILTQLKICSFSSSEEIAKCFICSQSFCRLFQIDTTVKCRSKLKRLNAPLDSSRYYKRGGEGKWNLIKIGSRVFIFWWRKKKVIGYYETIEVDCRFDFVKKNLVILDSTENTSWLNSTLDITFHIILSNSLQVLKQIMFTLVLNIFRNV